MLIEEYLHFQSNPLMNLKIFATVHSLMNYTKLIAKLTCPCNMLRTSNSVARSDTGVEIDSEPHRSRTCKQASCLLHWLSVFKLPVLLFYFTFAGTDLDTADIKRSHMQETS